VLVAKRGFALAGILFWKQEEFLICATNNVEATQLSTSMVTQIRWK